MIVTITERQRHTIVELKVDLPHNPHHVGHNLSHYPIKNPAPLIFIYFFVIF